MSQNTARIGSNFPTLFHSGCVSFRNRTLLLLSGLLRPSSAFRRDTRADPGGPRGHALETRGSELRREPGRGGFWTHRLRTCHWHSFTLSEPTLGNFFFGLLDLCLIWSRYVQAALYSSLLRFKLRIIIFFLSFSSLAQVLFFARSLSLSLPLFLRALSSFSLPESTPRLILKIFASRSGSEHIPRWEIIGIIPKNALEQPFILVSIS